MDENGYGDTGSKVRRPVPKYQHYIDHFEELYRQSPLAKVVVHSDQSIPSSKHIQNQTQLSNASSSFKVPNVSSLLKPRPVTTPVGAFMMSPVGQLIKQMQSSGDAIRGDPEEEGASDDRVESYPGNAQHREEQDDGNNDAIQRDEPPGDDDDDDGPNSLHESHYLPGSQSGSPKHGEVPILLGENASVISSVPGVQENKAEIDANTDNNINERLREEETPVGISRKRRESSRVRNLKAMAVKSSSDGELSSYHGPSKQSEKPITELDQWIIKWLGSGMNYVAVEGHRLEDPEGSFWHSTAIYKRISSCLVETRSGSRYRLLGNINKLLAMDQGFSLKCVHRFHKGFPFKWKAFLAEEAKQKLHTKDGAQVAESSETENSKTSHAPSVRTRKSSKHKTHKTQKEEKSQANEKTPGIKATTKITETTPVTRKKESVVVTPSFVSVDEVQTTKSGRKVLPPLQYWRGQRQRTLLYMDGAAELLEGSIDHTPVSATSLHVRGSIELSERAKRLPTRKTTSSGRRHISKVKAQNKDNSFHETNDEDDISKKKVGSEKSKRSRCISRAPEKSKRDCSLEAMQLSEEKKGLQRSRRKSSNSSDHHSQDQSGSSETRQGGAACVKEIVCDADRTNQSYDLYGAVMGVVKLHHQRRKSSESKRRHSRETHVMSLASPNRQEQVESSFNISDDEEFMNDSAKSVAKKGEVNTSSSRNMHKESKQSRTTSKTKGKGIHKKMEKSLLGSNMLPSVILDKDESLRMTCNSAEGTHEKDLKETDGKKAKTAPRPRRSRRNNRQQEEENEPAEENTNKWKPDELHRLHRALKTIPPSSRQFWHRVASIVETRTEWECQQVHQAKLEDDTKTSKKEAIKKPQESKQVVKEPVAITARKGTIKRKRQLKELIQQHNQASEEDLFDSTPFKRKKNANLPLLNLNLREDEDDEEVFEGKTPGSARLKTPSTRFPQFLAPLSGKKTPHTNAFSPGLLHSVEKKHVDQYIFGMQKKRPGKRWKKRPGERLKKIPESSPLKTRPTLLRSSTIAVTPSISKAFQPDPPSEEERDEDEADYYWSDEENKN